MDVSTQTPAEDEILTRNSARLYARTDGFLRAANEPAEDYRFLRAASEAAESHGLCVW